MIIYNLKLLTFYFELIIWIRLMIRGVHSGYWVDFGLGISD